MQILENIYIYYVLCSLFEEMRSVMFHILNDYDGLMEVYKIENFLNFIIMISYENLLKFITLCFMAHGF